jgi:hypothetical protein
LNSPGSERRRIRRGEAIGHNNRLISLLLSSDPRMGIIQKFGVPERLFKSMVCASRAIASKWRSDIAAFV